MKSRTLRQRAINSGTWILFGHLFSQVLRLGSNLILTRLLVPEMFGVMSLVTVIRVGLMMFSDVGLLQNIVQSKRGEERDYLNTAWTIQIIRGFVLFFIALLLSAGLFFLAEEGYLSRDTAYGHAQLPLALAIVSSTLLISGFNSIHLLVLNRKLMVGKLTAIELFSQIIGILFMVRWAQQYHDIWALVYGGLISASIKMVLSHITGLGERCRFCWDREAVHEIINFGKWIFVASILGFLLNQGDRLILGGMVTSELLGVYSIAFFLATAVLELLRKIIDSVFFPVLSDVVRNTPERLEKIYYQMRSKVDAISMFSAGVLFSTAKLVISMLYGARYIEAGWMLQILSLSVITTGWLLGNHCFIATAKVKIVTFSTLLQVLFIYTAIPVAFYYYGVVGGIYAIALSPIFRALIVMMLMKKNLFLNLAKELRMIPLFFIGLFLGKAFVITVSSYL